jgi:hypothetical protein
MICSASEKLSSTPPVIDTDVLEESIATSEIFRHTALIYLFRVTSGDNVPLDSQTQESFDEVIPFLHIVAYIGIPIIIPCSRVQNPLGMELICSALGPGSILGWSLTVMGCEIPSTMEEEREYLRCRWGGIHGLGMRHSFKAAELLEVFTLVIVLT